MEEAAVKGIITRATAYGEYGRRLVIVTDRLGKISAFAGGAARSGSRIIGSVRPMTCASFTLAKGKDAWNVHAVDVIDAFTELSADYDASVYGAYVMETGEAFSAEGMPEADAKALLNLMYVTLKAIRESVTRKKDAEAGRSAGNPENPGGTGMAGRLSLIRRMYELRLLKLQGEYDEEPGSGSSAETAALWAHCLKSGLGSLFDTGLLTGIKSEAAAEFKRAESKLFIRQAGRRFKSAALLEESGSSSAAAWGTGRTAAKSARQASAGVALA